MKLEVSCHGHVRLVVWRKRGHSLRGWKPFNLVEVGEGRAERHVEEGGG